jgi:hypothetical protein
MGCFAFECRECGSHDQDGIVRGCVVKVSGVWVRGEYSEYGWVECALEGQDDPVQVWLQQFQSDYFESWGVPGDALLGGAWAQRNGFTEAQAAVIREYVWPQDEVPTLAGLHEMDAECLIGMLQDMQLHGGEEARFRSLLAADATAVAEFNAAWDREHKREDEDEEDTRGS